MNTMLESPKIEKPVDTSVGKYVAKGVEEALGIVRHRFEQASEQENNLEFHNTRHTEDVVRRTELILRTIKASAPEALSEKDIALGKLAAAFHDVVQEWQEQCLSEKTVRQRRVGANEQASADAAIAFLEKTNRESGEERFTGEDLGTVVEAINGTVPGWNAEKRTVTQPNVTERSSLLAKALALADLGTAGMDGAEAFLREGDALFREEHLDIGRALEHKEAVSEEEKARYRERMLGWTRFQSEFVTGRKNLLDEELKGIPEAAKEAVRKLFATFDESAAAATKRAKIRETMSFDELAADMGFFPKKETLAEAKERQRVLDEAALEKAKKSLR